MWFKIQNDLIELRIFVKPNAKKSALIAVDDNELKIAVHARAQDGEGNIELIHYLSKLFQCPKSKINLLRGDTSRYKKVAVPLTPTTQAFINNPCSFLER
jgi:uncharacterized protein (TIGR00251 family)